MRILAVVLSLVALSLEACATTVNPQFEEAVQDLNKTREVEEAYVMDSQLSFYGKPPEVVTLTMYENGSLVCQAGGTPQPFVYWVKDGVKLAQDYDLNNYFREGLEAHNDSTENMRIGSTNARLNFDCVTSEHSGEYKCVAENGYDSISANTAVQVVSEGTSENQFCPTEREFGTKPQVVMWSDTTFEYIGKDAKIFCRAIGDPEPSITWYGLDDVPLPFQSSKYEVSPDGDLVVSSVQWDDKGDYACVASNAHGMDRVRSFLYPTAPKE